MRPFRHRKDLPLTPVRTQLVTPDEFLELYSEKGSEIESARIIPPIVGNKGFGYVLITWKNPVFVSYYDLMDEVAAH